MRDVSLPMLAICCGKDISVHRPFSGEVCNLYDDGKGQWSAVIIGAASFAPGNSDWACDEVFDNREHPLKWSSCQSWEKTLAQMESHLKKYLKKGKYASLLRSKQGLGLGFVDGDLILL